MPNLSPVLLGLLVSIVTACSTPTQVQQHRPSTVDQSEEFAAALRGYSAVMAATTTSGQRLVADDRAVVFVVFASWCGHCRTELAQLAQLRKRYNLRIIGLNAYEEYRQFSDTARMQLFVETNAPWLTEIVIADASMLEQFGKVPKIPALFVYDNQGRVVAEYRRDKHPAPPTAVELERVFAIAVSAGNDSPK